MPRGNRSILLSFVFSTFSYHCHVGALSMSFSSKQNTGMEKCKNVLPPNWNGCSDAEHQESKNQPEQQPQTALTSAAAFPADISANSRVWYSLYRSISFPAQEHYTEIPKIFPLCPPFTFAGFSELSPDSSNIFRAFCSSICSKHFGSWLRVLAMMWYVVPSRRFWFRKAIMFSLR